MEYFDILNYDGTKTGIIKEREQVHTDGDLHGTSHIWIARRGEGGNIRVLLQRRSKNKDSFPDCLDTSSAGHIESGHGYLDSALRELGEELGLFVKPESLIFMFDIKTYKEGFFHGKIFRDNQLSRVYLLDPREDISDIKIQKAEIEEVLWQDYDYIAKKLSEGSSQYCINIEEFTALGKFLLKTNI